MHKTMARPVSRIRASNVCRACIIFFTLFVAGGSDASAEDATVGPNKGSLLIVGGGGAEFDRLFRVFVGLAGGDDAHIVIVPTAASSSDDYNYDNHRGLSLARDAIGVKHVTIVHTHDPAVADTEEFTRPIQEADGVWFTGGRQWRLVDAYGGTRAEEEFRNVLKRGGVIGGSSAGATIQGSFLVRGDTRGNQILIGDHQRGFGYIKNSAIDQHVVPRRRQLDMIRVLTDPEGKMDPSIDRAALLGIGIDEDTAILVHGNEFQVMGAPAGRVLVYDPTRWTPGTADDDKYLTLWVGAKYDMKERRVLDNAR